MNNKRIQQLSEHYLEGTLLPHEWKELREYLLAGEDHPEFNTVLQQTIEEKTYEPADKAILQRILRNISHKKNQQHIIAPVHRVHFLKTAWFRVAVVILLFSGVGAYLWLRNPKPGLETATIKPVPEKNDVMPGSDKAILTLSDGRKITLDSTAGKTIEEGDLQIQNNNNGLVYANSDVVVNNTMSTPKGGQYQLTLSDGTKVWLNAASSITFPTTFKGSNREVSISGEVYFDVKPDKQKPFIINTRDQKIEVLGTELNVYTYEDEKVKISLVNGAIKMNNKVLKPGQAFIDGNIQSTNIAQDIAWKNGVFDFNNTDLSSAFRQLSRWYDVDILVETTLPNKIIGGKMGRDLTLAQVLRILKRMGINTKLENRQLIILSE